MAKLMVSIRDENFRLLSFEARERGITIQELIRAVIVPDWVRSSNIARPPTDSGQVRHLPIISRESNSLTVLSQTRK